MAAWMGCFVVCWAWMPATHNSPFSLGEFQVSWAFIFSTVVFAVAMKTGK
jgi:hypothetical protein